MARSAVLRTIRRWFLKFGTVIAANQVRDGLTSAPSRPGSEPLSFM
jgi:hypothetical protein